MSAGTATAADPDATAAPNSSASPAAESDKDDSTAAFGKTYTYDDGLAVTVVDKGKFKPSQYAAAEKAKSYRKFQITLKNGTKERFEPTLFQATLQDGEAEADSVFDSAKKLKGAPNTKLLPGRTVKWLVGYGVDTKDLVMEVTPDFEHEAVIFQSE